MKSFIAVGMLAAVDAVTLSEFWGDMVFPLTQGVQFSQGMEWAQKEEEPEMKEEQEGVEDESKKGFFSWTKKYFENFEQTPNGGVYNFGGTATQCIEGECSTLEQMPVHKAVGPVIAHDDCVSDDEHDCSAAAFIKKLIEPKESDHSSDDEVD